MNTAACIKTILGADESALVRGVNLGDPISEILAKEGKGYEFNDNSIPLYSYNVRLGGKKKFRFKVIYYAEDGQTLDEIVMDAIDDKDRTNDLTPEEFESLYVALRDHLAQAYGAATSTRGKRESTEAWILDPDGDAPIEVALMRWSDSRSDVRDAIKITFQYHYD